MCNYILIIYTYILAIGWNIIGYRMGYTASISHGFRGISQPMYKISWEYMGISKTHVIFVLFMHFVGIMGFDADLLQ